MSEIFKKAQFRTPIRIQRNIGKRETGKLEAPKIWVDIGNRSPDDLPIYRRCQWIGQHGGEGFSEDALQGVRTATLRMRCISGITQSDTVLLGEDRWEIESIDDVREMHALMEIRVKRKVAG